MPVAATQLSDLIEKGGAYAGIAACLGLAMFIILYFGQARELKRLREWAGRAPERAQELEARVLAQADAARRVRAQPPRPAAAPATAAGAAASGTVAAAGPAAATPAGAAAPAPATAGAIASDGAEAPEAGEAAVPAAAADGEAATEGVAAAAATDGEAATEGVPAEGETPPAAAEATGAETPAGVGADGTPAGEVDASKAAEPAEPAESAESAEEAVGADAAPQDAPATANGDRAAEAPLPVAAATAAAAARARSAPGPPSGEIPPTVGPPVAGPPSGEIPAARPLPARPASPGVRRPASRPAPAAALRSGAAATRRPPGRPGGPGRPTARAPEGRGRGRTAALVGSGLAAVVVLGIAAVSLLGGDDEPKTAATSRGASTAESTATPTATPGRSSAPATERSDYTVAVLNGTTTTGLASGFAGRVAEAGFKPGTTANFIDQTRAASLVFYSDAPGARRAANQVAKLLDADNPPTVQQLDATVAELAGDAQVVVVVGADQSP